jgi:hypothetical protein
MREAAAGQDNAAFGMNANKASLPFDHCAAHRAVLNNQFADGGRQPQRYLQIERGFRKASGQRIAVRECHAAAVAHDVHEMPGQSPGDVDRRGQRFGRAHEVDNLLARSQHHAEHGQFRQRRAEKFDVRAELASVEGPRHHRAAALRATGGFRVIIGKHQGHVETQGGLRGKEVDGFRSGTQKGIDPRRVEAVAGLVPQIAARLIRTFDDPPLARQRRSGNPEPSAGARGGAAETGFLLDDQDIEAAMTCGDRRGHAGGAGADHQRVAFIRRIHAIVLNVCHAASLFFQKRTFGYRWRGVRSRF